MSPALRGAALALALVLLCACAPLGPSTGEAPAEASPGSGSSGGGAGRDETPVGPVQGGVAMQRDVYALLEQTGLCCRRMR